MKSRTVPEGMAADLHALAQAARAHGPREPSMLRHFMRARMGRLRYPGGQAEQLLLAPQELRTADPSFATELYNGHFGLAGRLAELGSQSPFQIAPPSEAWERELHGFSWLRHLRAAGSELSREQAKALVGDWLKLHRNPRGIAWQPEIVARRIISWLANSMIVLDASDPRSYNNFLRALTAQLRYLSASYKDAPDGVPRLVCLMALIYGGLCIAEQQAVIDRYIGRFGTELERQILPDGGHISRNPAALIELLLDLLPFRQCFIARDRLPPKQLSDAIDRAMPMLRFFRLGDGSFARFNGSGATPTDALATVLAYDDTEGAPLREAPYSGYARMLRGETLLIADIGGAPPESLSSTAHAGCLSFELSSGNCPIVVNCGEPSPDYPDWRGFARISPGHSTLSFAEASSAMFAGANGSEPPADAPLSGPANAKGGFRDDVEGPVIGGSHDGYLERFGIQHQRQMHMSAAGDRIEGEDTLIAPGGLKDNAGAQEGGYAIRFHLHPSVAAHPVSDGESVLLELPNREVWKLSADAPALDILDSVFLADERGPQPSLQIVLSGAMGSGDREQSVAWRIERMSQAGEAVRPNASSENERGSGA